MRSISTRIMISPRLTCKGRGISHIHHIRLIHDKGKPTP